MPSAEKKDSQPRHNRNRTGKPIVQTHSFMSLQYLTIFVLLLAAPLAFSSLTTTVDRTSLTTIEVLTLVVRLDNVDSDDAPDFTPLLSEFEIVQQSGPNVRENLTILNGRRVQEKRAEWRVLLRPKRKGQLLVPALSAAGHQSRAFTVSVDEPSQALKRQLRQYVFFKTEVDRESTYVQGQFIYSVRLFYTGYISGDPPGAPALTDAIVEVLEPNRRYEEVVDGRNYYVLEVIYGIYPLKSGTLTLPPETFFGTRNVRGIRQRTERVSAISEGHTLSVVAKPAAFPNDNWLPASALELTETWSPEQDTFEVGEPINRIITLRANGVSSSVLPRLSFDAGDLAKTYADPPIATDQLSANGTTGQLKTSIGIVPTEPGKLSIPTIQVPWWNTNSETLQWAELPGRVITIKPLAAPANITPTQTPSTTQTAPEVVTEIRYHPISWYLAGLFLLLWLATLALLVFRRRPGSPEDARHTQQPQTGRDEADPATHFSTLQIACRRNDAAGAIDALSQWLRATIGPAATITHWLQQQTDSEIAQHVTHLQASLYSPEGATWQEGAALIALIERAELERESNDNAAANKTVLAALNPG